MKRMWLHTLVDVDPNKHELKQGQTEENWYYEGRRNDLHSFFTHWELKSFDNIGSVFTVAGGVGVTVATEKALIATLWDELNMVASYHTLSGWRMTDVIWPKLINRSVHYGLQIPQNFKLMALQPTRRFSEGGFYDLYNIYKQGIYYRPDIELHEALEFWIGEGTHSENTMAMSHINKVKGIDIVATLDRQIDMMEQVARIYDV